MVIKTMDASIIQKCFLAGANAIDAKKEVINDLNVFPVPDGDTGTNMTMTIMTAAGDVAALQGQDVNMKRLCKAISSGSLRGARGNSGVILSQLLRGFTKEIADKDEVDVHVFTSSFERAVELAYKAVMKPKEGTILTVARAGAEKAVELLGRTDNLVELANSVLMHMRDVLEQTPDMLPVLKEAGVVDSGGEGLLTILEGAYDALLGKDVNYEVSQGAEAAVSAPRRDVEGAAGSVADADIKFGYCTEFIIMPEKVFSEEDESEFKGYLESIGDSIVCVADDELVKVHVHTNDPGLAIQKALTYGALTRMKIDNMREEHNERVIHEAERKAAAGQKAPKKEKTTEQKLWEVMTSGKDNWAGPEANDVREDEQPVVQEVPTMPHKENGFISVSVGSGLDDIFRDLGVDFIIEGGQTMNPSTEDILSAIRMVNADNIFILPNNSNIILAAEQAKKLTEDKNIVVIPSKNIPQGIAAMINYVEGLSTEQNADAMTESLSAIRSGQVTYAVRDTAVGGQEIKAGDFMGLSDKTIETVGTDVVDTTIALLKKMMDEDSELVTIYYGEEGTEEDAEKIAAAVQLEDSEVEVEIHYGGQPIYYYFVSVE